MIVWRGCGIVVLIFAGLGIAGARHVAERVWGLPLAADKVRLCEFVGLMFAAAAVYGLHRLLLKSDPPRMVVDKKTGHEIELVAKHDLFFVPLQYWSYVLAGVGVFLAMRA